MTAVWGVLAACAVAAAVDWLVFVWLLRRPVLRTPADLAVLHCPTCSESTAHDIDGALAICGDCTTSHVLPLPAHPKDTP